MTFPEIKAGTATVQSLHAYSRILGSIRAAGSEPHPRWWHASLEVINSGWTTGRFALVNGAEASLVLSPANGSITGRGSAGRFEVGLEGPADQVGREVLERLGGSVEVDPDRWSTITADRIDTAEAEDYQSALVAVRDSLAAFRSGLEGEVGPVQLWPHHFDLSFEWFSPAVEVYEDEDGSKEFNKQIGFGFSPGDEGDPQPYFYANPWPFDEAFRSVELPAEASWHEKGWSGAFLPYSKVVERGSGLLDELMTAVWDGTHHALE